MAASSPANSSRALCTKTYKIGGPTKTPTSSSRLKSIMNNLGEKLTVAERKEMIGEADTGKDSQVNYRRFLTTLAST
ncbi:hypothetical protein HPB48_017875 [Haemaphysalis longicornis]|uniref:Uncharacterized protein n=1 Tax=Haemaphysalis longicornis TaxID=44386 RepID=A0A9J6GQ99_HAELO|nr:hypothetical protein HPB48_017875 [Haemaphysalis longicornis]